MVRVGQAAATSSSTASGMSSSTLAALFITYQFARRGLLDRHKLILATQLVLQVLRKAGSLVEAEVDFLTHGYIAGNSSLPPIPPQAALFLLS